MTLCDVWKCVNTLDPLTERKKVQNNFQTTRLSFKLICIRLIQQYVPAALALDSTRFNDDYMWNIIFNIFFRFVILFSNKKKFTFSAGFQNFKADRVCVCLSVSVCVCVCVWGGGCVCVSQVTLDRLWKIVYNELGGCAGSTSAATCTRRHYERSETFNIKPSTTSRKYERILQAKTKGSKCKSTCTLGIL